MTSKPWSSTAPPGEFRPYVEAGESQAEFSLRAVILGAVFGLIFGAVTVYVGLRAGLTVSASIPIAVLSISLLRAFGKASILENNIVQTTGSAGESVAAGVIFTLPALIFLGFPFEYSRIFLLALIGGWLGVLFMIPLRRQLIVKEHGNLLYPEGTACADVLVAGERGGSFASRVFWGLGIGGVYTALMTIGGFWRGRPEYQPKWLPGASFRADITAEYLGVGYIIGPRIAGTIFAGGVFSWLVIMPAIKFFGQFATEPLYPSTVPISEMRPQELWELYIRPMGAGAVAAAGLITLLRTMPTIVAALRAGMKDIRSSRGEEAVTANRIDRDLSMRIVVFGSIAIVAMMWLLLTFRPIQNAPTGLVANLVTSLFVVVFGFLFVTVSSRICGLIGTSANPVSGMTIATLMATCAMFLAAGWRGGAYPALALTVGGVVCIAAANAGATSQDLKTGYLVGATPSRQQVGLMIGVMASVFVIGLTLILMNRGLQQYRPPDEYQAKRLALDAERLPEGVQIEARDFAYRDKTYHRVMASGSSALADGVYLYNLASRQIEFEYRPIHIDLKKLDEGIAVESREYNYKGKNYILINALGSKSVPDGKYLYDPATGKVEIQWVPGIGSDQAAAPQAKLMATVISGILSQRLPWRLVLLGVFFVIAVELLGVRSLSFAVGSYLSIATTMAIFAGGVVRWLAERDQKLNGGHAESEVSPGSLYASGLIAAGGVIGLTGILIKVLEDAGAFRKDLFKIGPNVFDAIGLGGWAHRELPAPFADPVAAHVVAVVMFVVLAASLYRFARKKLD